MQPQSAQSLNPHCLLQALTASNAGLPAIEFRQWTDKDLGAISAALRQTGLAVSSILAEPVIPLTDPPTSKRGWKDWPPR
ncbi:hypothetical protein AM571_CH03611 [Rhizobium etli 8C-3]|uniref:Uncharacterized protein n=1 Tax=Rhizobium etli 8C-3 TaxID=538025 RepID=A0A1L5P8J4_RHIET|nr:hypothetical protein AM571_CH03611 [Rhizobium etli 8C-3]